jgi:hypothetical protein
VDHLPRRQIRPQPGVKLSADLRSAQVRQRCRRDLYDTLWLSCYALANKEQRAHDRSTWLAICVITWSFLVSTGYRDHRRRANLQESPTQVAVRSSLLARLRRWNPTRRVRRVPPRKGSIPRSAMAGVLLFVSSVTFCLKTALIGQAPNLAKSGYPPIRNRRPRDTRVHFV